MNGDVFAKTCIGIIVILVSLVIFAYFYKGYKECADNGGIYAKQFLSIDGYKCFYFKELEEQDGNREKARYTEV